MVHRPRPVVLCILDGWGMRAETESNALALASTPVFDKMWAEAPHTLLQASEENVGLPKGQMGNSEVGHMNLGAGRIVLQDLPKIDRAVESGEIKANPTLRSLIEALKASRGTCHLMGLTSPGGVHSHQNHMIALAKVLSEAGVPVAFHAFLDGRDVLPRSALDSIKPVIKALASFQGVRLATLCGRYYAMDRDKRWERVEKAYDLLVAGKGEPFNDPLEAIKASYDAGVSDEFVKPVVLGGYAGMNDGDGVVFANFRTDRARELLTALCVPAFDGFARSRILRLAAVAGMVEYAETITPYAPALFPPKRIDNSLGEVVANAGLTQLRLAETEKYPHVTFFFNGGREEPFKGEERILVPSPKVPTYDLKPEMSAVEVTDKAVKAIAANRFDLIVMNYANPDMVGHTGDLAAAIKAVETVDVCLGRVVEAVEKRHGLLFVVGDHGNCENMVDPETKGPHTAHTVNPVPFIALGAGKAFSLRTGKLADVAPTMLSLMEMPKPEEMDGNNLIVRL
ncbi:MAG: 2,3-bisphosphoglycerate-independent phosphoglycerate mutase [Alphaproteobacteria bacterium]|nr:2,3-bisphosphoglycerate-independent phosphoglycerate mutase [Alphaproteobacteria bacterium]